MDTTGYRAFLKRIVAARGGERLDEAVGLGLVDPVGHLKSVSKDHGGGAPILWKNHPDAGWQHVGGVIPHPKGDLDTARSMAEHTAKATGGKVYKTYTDHWQTDGMVHTGYGVSGKSVTGKDWDINYSPHMSVSDHMKAATGEGVDDPEGTPSGISVHYRKY